MKVSVFGLGMSACVSAASFAGDGHEVVGVDVNADKVAPINAGRSPIVEPGLDELLAQGVADGRLRATTDTADGDSRQRRVAAVRRHAEPHERQPRSAPTSSASAKQIGGALEDKPTYHVVVVRSTVLPGTTHDVVIPALERASGKKYGDGLRRLGQPGVPARRHGAQGLPQAAADAGRPQPRRRRQRDDRALPGRSTRRSSAPASASPR